jgi:ABC-type glycerol-3-phosphate transport system substrate-binding protein
LVRTHQSGHLIALDTVLPADTLTPYYGFAQALGQVEGAWVGIPWAADARILVYDTLQYADPPVRWSDVVTGPFLLPAAETSGLTLLTTYLALGGIITSPSGQVILDAEILAETLSLYQAAYAAEVIPLSTLTATDPETTWQLFRGQNAALAATSAHWYLTEYQRDLTTNATLLPISTGEALALADGWCWALVNAIPEQQAQTVELLRWLTAPEQAGAWTQAADLLPTSPSSVRQWGTPTRTRAIEAILKAAQLQPSADVLAQVGPPLRQALEEVLSERATPIVAATNAAQALTQP